LPRLAQGTLQHVRHPNIFALGDCSSLPTSKTAAAVAAQFTVLRANLLDAMAGVVPRSAYTGYTSCPVVAGRDRLMLMEFDYDLKPCETFPWDQRKVDGNTGAFAFWLKKVCRPRSSPP
jgi:NADPH-dependent 2,4-dienoyl-CoA reductase/sulfur reductase-like enzyme